MQLLAYNNVRNPSKETTNDPNLRLDLEGNDPIHQLIM